MSKINNQLDSTLPINKFSHDIIEEYEVNNSNTEWLNSLLTELEEDIDEEESYPLGSLNLKAQITRKNSHFLGDHIVVRAQLTGAYHLPCGKCLAPVSQKVDLKLNAAYIHDSNEKKPEYAECTTVFADNEEMELYFFRKGQVNIEEFIHEQTFIEVEPFPRCSGECKNPLLY